MHKGYLHQDMLAACALARLHLPGNTDTVVLNDVKDHHGDRFDDVTILGATNRRQQVKWHEDVARLLGVSDLRTTKIGFKISDVLSSFLGDTTRALEYRLVTTCAGPDADLSGCLVEAPSVPPSSPGLMTRRFRLSASAVWPEVGAPSWDELGSFERQDFVEFCDAFVIETSCPRCSLDLRAPGELESHLLSLLEDGLGVGRFPNAALAPVQAAALLVHLASSARADKLPRGREEVRAALDLEIDFGRVPEVLPVDAARLVSTPGAITSLVEQITNSPVVVVRGAPGSGKSWLLEELRKHLLACGQLAVAHYCFVGLGDQDQQRRSTADVVFGSLIAELQELDSSLVTGAVPRYAAGPRELERILEEAMRAQPDRLITLIVDGLDHADRLPRPGARLALDLAQELAELDLPVGVQLVIGSQEGGHLDPLRKSSTITDIRPWTDDQIRALAARAGVQGSGVVAAHAEDIVEILNAICDKAQGNPLYATYLSRTMLGVSSGEIKMRSEASIAEYLRHAPAFDEGLSSYYEWLFDAATGDLGAEVIVTALALAGLPLSAAELAQIFPIFAFGDTIPQVLSLLSPVLLGDVVTDEVRIYHESFQRFVVAKADNPAIRKAVFEPLIAWLQACGFFEDLRAFRWLMPTLCGAGRYAEVVGLCNPDFVSNAVAGGQPGDAVMANLALAAQTARELGMLADLVRIVELNRAADSAYHWVLNDDGLAPLYARAFVALNGAAALSQRLLHDGRSTFHPRVGIMFCHLCDRAGAVPEWYPHLRALERFRGANNITYMGGEHNVDVARVAGELRLAGAAGAPLLMHAWLSEDQDSRVHPYTLAETFADMFGTQALVDVLKEQAPGQHRGWALLAAARSCTDLAGARPFAAEAVAGGLDDRTAIRVALQVLPESAELFARQDIEQLTGQVNDERGHMRTEDSLDDWFAELDIAAALGDHAALHRVENLIQGPGWYRRWLRFVVRLRVRPHPADVLEELTALSVDIDPYQGTPNVNQLYFAREEIESSLRQAMTVMDDGHFAAAAEALFTLSGNDNASLNPRRGPWPLELDDVLKLLLSTSDTDTKRTIASEVSAAHFVPGREISDVYPAHAANRLLLARLHSRADKEDLALEAWNQACVFICAYGHRKDLTVFEISDALPALGAADPARVIACITATHPLVEAVIAHTDLSGTKHAVSSWARDAVAFHPPSGLLHIAMRTFKGLRPAVSFDGAMAAGIAALSGVVPDGVLQACWVALGEAAIAEAEAALRSCEVPTAHSHEAWQLVLVGILDNDPTELTQEVVDLLEESAARMGEEMPQVRAWGQQIEDPADNSLRPKGSASLPPDFSIVSEASATQVAHAVRRWRSRRSTADLKSVVTSVLDKVDEIDARDGEEASWLVHRIGADSFILSEDPFLSDLADGLERRGKSRLAATLLTLIYTRTIDGWRILAGSVAHFVRAVELDESAAWETLTRELADSVKPGANFGSTGHLLELLTNRGRVDDAYACWEEARKAIAHRLPPIGRTDASAVPFDPTADDILASTAACLVARLLGETGREAVLDGVRILLQQNEDEAIQVAAHMIAFAVRYLPHFRVDDLLAEIEESEVEPFEVTRKAADVLSAVAADDIYSLSDKAQRLLGRGGIG